MGIRAMVKVKARRLRKQQDSRVEDESKKGLDGKWPSRLLHTGLRRSASRRPRQPQCVMAGQCSRTRSDVEGTCRQAPCATYQIPLQVRDVSFEYLYARGRTVLG